MLPYCNRLWFESGPQCVFSCIYQNIDYTDTAVFNACWTNYRTQTGKSFNMSYHIPGTGVKSFGLVVSRLEDAWPCRICVSIYFLNFVPATCR